MRRGSWAPSLGTGGGVGGEEQRGGVGRVGAHLAAPGQQLTDPAWLMVSSTVAGGERAELSVARVQGLVPGPHLSGQGSRADTSSGPGQRLAYSQHGAWGASSPNPRARGWRPGCLARVPRTHQDHLCSVSQVVVMNPLPPQTPRPPQGPPGRAIRGSHPQRPVWGGLARRVFRRLSRGVKGRKHLLSRAKTLRRVGARPGERQRGTLGWGKGAWGARAQGDIQREQSLAPLGQADTSCRVLCSAGTSGPTQFRHQMSPGGHPPAASAFRGLPGSGEG